MTLEGRETDKKSLRVLEGKAGAIAGLTHDCVAFANCVGRRLLIGIEDDQDEPPANQRVDRVWLERLPQRISQLTLNVGVAASVETARNGGEYLELRVARNAQTIAATSDGRYFIRAADETKPLLPDELGRLMSDKTAYVWETQTTKRVPRRQADGRKLREFVERVGDSDRVSAFVKGKTPDELLDYYLLAREEYLTNLGVLWVGRREDRATLLFAPCVQFLKYDERGERVNKLLWDDFSLNPLELIDAVLREIPDWRESYELPDGMFRKTVPHYDEVVVRELVANALAHRPYTQRGDIFINLHPDRLEVHNPGLLPLGVTARNILHASVRRNEHLAKVFYDLKAMEREGSGYDRMYEALLSTARPLPEVREGDDRVSVAVQKRILDPAIIEFLFKADGRFQLSQKERITLGLLAQHESLTGIELERLLGLRHPQNLKPWLGRLPAMRLLRSRGRTKGKEYQVAPELLRKMSFRGATTLRGIESHRLRELILRDLEIYRDASIGEIRQRIGAEIPPRRVKRELDRLCQDGAVVRTGEKRWTRYRWP
jgi:ATP-dependent DNA helicase RecG